MNYLWNRAAIIIAMTGRSKMAVRISHRTAIPTIPNMTPPAIISIFSPSLSLLLSFTLPMSRGKS